MERQRKERSDPTRQDSNDQVIYENEQPVKFKTADVKKHIKRRLLLWKNKQINELVGEGSSILNQLSREGKKLKDMEEITRSFPD